MSGGHGHVVPRSDGAKARCGGPALCGVCAKELAAQSATVTAPTPEQAAYEAFRKAFPGEDWGPWDSPNVSDTESRDGWKSIAQAAIDAFLAGDSVSAESIREALAAQERPAPDPAYDARTPRDAIANIRAALEADADPGRVIATIAALAASAAGERPAPGARFGFADVADERDQYYETLQRIVDAVASGDAAAVDKLARNALGLTRVGRPAPFREERERARLARARWLEQAAMHERDAGRFTDPAATAEFSAKARVYRALADELAEIAGLPS